MKNREPRLGKSSEETTVVYSHLKNLDGRRQENMVTLFGQIISEKQT